MINLVPFSVSASIFLVTPFLLIVTEVLFSVKSNSTGVSDNLTKLCAVIWAGSSFKNTEVPPSTKP